MGSCQEKFLFAAHYFEAADSISTSRADGEGSV